MAAGERGPPDEPRGWSRPTRSLYVHLRARPRGGPAPVASPPRSRRPAALRDPRRASRRRRSTCRDVRPWLGDEAAYALPAGRAAPAGRSTARAPTRAAPDRGAAGRAARGIARCGTGAAGAVVATTARAGPRGRRCAPRLAGLVAGTACGPRSTGPPTRAAARRPHARCLRAGRRRARAGRARGLRTAGALLERPGLTGRRRAVAGGGDGGRIECPRLLAAQPQAPPRAAA